MSNLRFILIETPVDKCQQIDTIADMGVGKEGHTPLPLSFHTLSLKPPKFQKLFHF